MVQGRLGSEFSQASLTSVLAAYRWAYRAVRSAAIPYHAVLAPISIGVRAMLLDSGDRVLLVRHTYLPGWHLPGGGVKRGETAYEAVRRELREETGFASDGDEELFGIYRNPAERRQDHVCLFLIRRFHEVGNRTASGLEIADSRFFPLSELPAETAPATLRRIEEVSRGRTPSHEW